MLKSFKYKFIIFFVALEIIFLSMIAIVNFNNISNSYEDFIKYKKDSLISLTQELLITPTAIYDLATIDNVVEKINNLKGVKSIKVWDSTDNLISESNKESSSSKFVNIEGDLESEGFRVGKFLIQLDLSNESIAIQNNQKQIIFIILIEIIISTFLSWTIGSRLSKNLIKIKNYAKNMSDNISRKIPFLKGEEEIEILSKTLEEVRYQLELDKYELDQYKDIIDENVIISRTDLKGKIVYASEAFCHISGYKKIELLGKNHNIVRHPDMPKEMYFEMWNCIKNDLIWNGEIKNKRKDQKDYWVNTTIYPWFDINGKKIGYIGIRQDITDKKIIEELSIKDAMTDIYNRRYFNDIFPKIINSAQRKNELINFIIMDVDHFKQYNDTYGHQMGDKVLINVAKCIKNSLQRADDYCFRLGGEEFGIIFNSISKEKSKEFAQNVRKNIENLKIEHSKNSASKYVTASLGLISIEANIVHDVDDIYVKADELLYEAKNSGRNRVSCKFN